jgi:hypothetical protein
MKDNKRKWHRHNEFITVIIVKPLSNGRKQINQFLTVNASEGGAFVDCEELDVLKVGNEYEGILDIESRQYKLNFKVIRTSKTIDKNKVVIDSGYGLMFIDPPIGMIEEIKIYIAKKKAQRSV